MSYLLIDFGASRVKVALYKDKTLQESKDYDPVCPIETTEKKFEVSPKELLLLFETIVEEYLSHSLKGIVICSEMHGFILQNQQGEFVTNYISWQDNRATNSIEGISSLDLIKQKFSDFKCHVGMSPRSGLPAVNFLHLIRTRHLTPGNYKIISLPEIFGATHIHTTLLAGLGIWDIYQNEIYQDLQNYFKSLGFTLSTNQPSSDVVRTAMYKGIPLYTAVGDNQCALYGIPLKEGQLVLNLGTGSQVAYIEELLPSGKLDQRPYFHYKNLSIITHIPSGRALNCFMGFLESCNSHLGGTKSPWDLLNSLSLKDVLQGSLTFDLAVFDSAYGFSQGGSISGIREENFSLESYMCSLLYSYIHQYINIIKNHNLPTQQLVLAGGIPKKLPVIKQVLEHSLNCSVIVSDNFIDESLVGLSHIADSLIGGISD